LGTHRAAQSKTAPDQGIARLPGYLRDYGQREETEKNKMSTKLVGIDIFPGQKKSATIGQGTGHPGNPLLMGGFEPGIRYRVTGQ